MTQQYSTKIEKQSWLNLKFAQLRYIFFTDKTTIFVSVIFVLWLVLDVYTGWKYTRYFKDLWNKELDQIATLATLIVAIFVWYGEILDEWKQSLPKRLTVEFKNSQGQRVLLCDKAHLSDVADIRALGQQIGLQMTAATYLEFRAPYVEQSTGEIKFDAKVGNYLHYEASFTFINLPESLSILLPGQYKYWQSPFTAADMQIKDNNR
jgi:hypothetical protein